MRTTDQTTSLITSNDRQSTPCTSESSKVARVLASIVRFVSSANKIAPIFAKMRRIMFLILRRMLLKVMNSCRRRCMMIVGMN